MEPWGILGLTGKVSEVPPSTATRCWQAASKSELVQLLQQAAVVHLIEGLRHIHIEHVHLFSVV